MATLIDSNIIIYSYSTEYQYLRNLLIDELSSVSEISKVEVLGYYGLTVDEESYFQDVFSFIPVIFPSQDIFDRAIEIRKQYHLKLADSIIAATALISNLTLYTRNVNDFNKIKGLKIINPIS